MEEIKARDIETVGDLMRVDYERDPVVQPVREKILVAAAEFGTMIADYQREQREQYEKSQREKK